MVFVISCSRFATNSLRRFMPVWLIHWLFLLTNAHIASFI